MEYQVISSGKNTQLHSYPNLETKYTYPHAGDESTDFQVIQDRNCFVEINKKVGFELLRTVTKNGDNSIQRLKKRQLPDDLACGAVSKLYGNQIALGMTNGYVRLFDVQSGEFMNAKLKPDRIGKSVAGLDYTNCDEHIATLYENGDINIFGLKTHVKTDSFRCDGLSTFIRFNPVKRFTLAVGSFEGYIAMLDIQNKRKLYMNKTAHNAPVQEIAMFSSSPDVFASCSFDCKINIYDLRERAVVQQWHQEYPMSTMCVSSCGLFCVTGNVQGEVFSFDFRNMKKPLLSKRAHDSAVTRIAFVPRIAEVGATSGQNTTATDMVTPLAPPRLPHKESMKSFMEFVDVCQYYNNCDNNLPSTIKKPKADDSWADLLPPLRDISVDSLASNTTALEFATPMSSKSNDTATDSLLNPRFSQSVLSDVETETPKISVSQSDPSDDELITPKILIQGTMKSKTSTGKRTRLSDFNRFGDLSEITEENDLRESTVRKTESKVAPNEVFANSLKDSQVSTPNNSQNKVNNNLGERNGTPAAGPDATIGLLRQVISRTIDRRMEELYQRLSNQLEERAASIIRRNDARLDEMANEIKFYQDKYYHTDFTGRYNLFDSLNKELMFMDEALAVLLRIPAAEEKFEQMKAENEELKAKLADRSSR